jgi:hypothetical protein
MLIGSVTLYFNWSLLHYTDATAPIFSRARLTLSAAEATTTLVFSWIPGMFGDVWGLPKLQKINGLV